MNSRRTVFLLFIVAVVTIRRTRSVPSTEQSRTRFNLTEEQPTGTFVADLKALTWYTNNPKLHSEHLVFVILSPDDALGRKLFTVEPSTGIVRTTTIVDRDSFCRRAVTCLVDLDIGVQPVAHFRLLKIAVEIADINDNAPRFTIPRIDHNLSESMAPGVLFPVDIADDPDSPLNGVARYQLVSNSQHFELQLPVSDDSPVFIDPPQLVLRQPLDRELQSLHQMKIIAYDAGNPPRSGSVLLDIVVTDSNDNGPRFVFDQYKAEVAENQLPSGSVVGVVASDADVGENAAIVYALSRRTMNAGVASTFAVDPSSGAVKLLKPLDYEQTGPIINFEIIASNLEPGEASSPTATTRVTIRVIDQNDNPPEITLDAATVTGNGGGPVVSVLENSAPDALVAHLSVTDPDTGDAGLVECTLGAGDNDAVQDVARYFRLVRVDDEDYQIVTSSNAVLDRESVTGGMFKLKVTCRDLGTDPGPMMSSIDFRVSVIDVDDNAPQFSRVVYNFSLNENAKPGTTVGRVSATDADTEYGGGLGSSRKSGSTGLRYYLHDDASDFVKIDPITGVITSSVSFDHETASVLRFHVLATSSSSSSSPEPDENPDASEHASRQTASALVIIVILNIDDEPPTFVEPSYEFQIAENQPPMTPIGHVTARDSDSPPFDVFRYRLDGGLDAEPFAVDPKTGVVSARQSLDRERQATYRLVAYAESASLPVFRRGSANVTVHVLDVNDNPPVVHYPANGNGTLRVSTRSGPGHVITRILASDVDVNDPLMFELFSVSMITNFEQNGESASSSSSSSATSASSSKGSLFRVDRHTGDVKVARQLDSAAEGVTFRLIISVSDGSSPPKSATATLYLVIVRDDVGAEKVWSPLGVGNGGSMSPSLSADNGDNFRLVLEGKVQLGVVVGIVAFSLVLMCTLLATILVCRRRRRHLAAISEPKDATEMTRTDHMQASTGGQDGERLNDEDASLCHQSTLPKNWTKLPVDVISNTATEIQSEPSPSWYGENQWTLGRTQGQGRFFQFDKSPGRKEPCSAVDRTLRQPIPTSVVFVDHQGSPMPSAPVSPPSSSTTLSSRPYYMDTNGGLQYNHFGTTPKPSLPSVYHQHYYPTSSPPSATTGPARTPVLHADGGSMRGRVRFRDAHPGGGPGGLISSHPRISFDQGTPSGDPIQPIPAYNDPAVTSMLPTGHCGNSVPFQTTLSTTSTSSASPSIFLRSAGGLQPDITASTTPQQQQQLTVDGGGSSGRSPLIFNRFSD